MELLRWNTVLAVAVAVVSAWPGGPGTSPKGCCGPSGDDCCGSDWMLHCCTDDGCCLGGGRLRVRGHHERKHHWDEDDWIPVTLVAILLVVMVSCTLLCCRRCHRAAHQGLHVSHHHKYGALLSHVDSKQQAGTNPQGGTRLFMANAPPPPPAYAESTWA